MSISSLCCWHGADFHRFGVDEDGAACSSLPCTLYTHHKLPHCLEAQGDEEVLERKQLPGRLQAFSILLLIPVSICFSENLVKDHLQSGFCKFSCDLLQLIRKSSLYS